MTTEQETQHIQQLLPLLAQRPYGYFIFDYEEVAIGVEEKDCILLTTRLKEEGLATTPNEAYMLAITSKGAAIAREPGGYLGYLASETKRKKTEETRAKGNFIGTFGSFIIAGLALLFALYTYVIASSDLKALEQRVQVLEQQLHRR